MAIVSYRCRELLRACLESLRLHPPGGKLAVHVVDNGSADGTVEMVRSEFPEVKLTDAGRNLGFAAASNLALRQGHAPYALVLNPDTRITEGALDRLLDLMDERPEVGMCGPRLELDDGSFDHAAKRSFPTPVSALGHFLRIGRRAGASGALAEYRAPKVRAGSVDAVNGAFMLIRRRALKEVGLFDEGFWMYMEDLDLCYRFARAGWVTWYEPSVTVAHVKAGSSGRLRSPRLNYAFHYGMYRFYRKHYAARRNPVLNLAVYLGIATKLCVSVVRTALMRRLPPSRRTAARWLKHRLLSAPPAIRDSEVLLGAYRLRQAAISAAGRRRHAGYTAPDGLPVPPVRLRVAAIGLASPASDIDGGRQSAAAIERVLREAGMRIGDFGSILDFGCGSGRVVRRWSALGKAEVFACDSNPDAVAWGAANLPFARFSLNRIDPPTDFPANRFDFVYALSVFTHLPATLQAPWLEELHRILRPGGHLLLTTAGATFRHLLPPDDRMRFDRGELIVHFPRSAGSKMCAAYHPPAFVKSLLSGRYELVHTLPAGPDSPYPEDMYLARTV